MLSLRINTKWQVVIRLLWNYTKTAPSVLQWMLRNQAEIVSDPFRQTVACQSLNILATIICLVSIGFWSCNTLSGRAVNLAYVQLV